MHDRSLQADPQPPQTPLPSAIESFDEVVLILGDRRPALFLDFDGTLAPIVPHPAQARLEPGVRPVLEALGRWMPIGVISGRSAQDVKDRLELASLQIAGDHGLVFLDADQERMAPPVQKLHLDALDTAARLVEKRIAPVDGAFVERKRCTFAVHTRQVEAKNKGAVLAAVEAVLTGAGSLQAQHGKEVVDVRPRVAWDKGAALDEMLRRLDPSKRNLMPMMIGDDVTDEPAFQRVRGHGVGVVVGHPERATAAEFTLGDPSEVKRFLSLLQERLGPRPGAAGPPGRTRRGPDL